jgi:hypothetical protein
MRLTERIPDVSSLSSQAACPFSDGLPLIPGRKAFLRYSKQEALFVIPNRRAYSLFHRATRKEKPNNGGSTAPSFKTAVIAQRFSPVGADSPINARKCTT